MVSTQFFAKGELSRTPGMVFLNQELVSLAAVMADSGNTMPARMPAACQHTVSKDLAFSYLMLAGHMRLGV